MTEHALELRIRILLSVRLAQDVVQVGGDPGREG